MSPRAYPIADFLEASPWAGLCLAADDRILAANAAARALFGSDPTGRPAIAVLRNPEFHAALEALDSGAPSGRADLTIAAPGGRGHFIIHVTRLSAKGERLAFFEDRTELDQAAAIRRDFVANVSHELRTPLTALSGFIETLRGAARDDSTARERFLSIMDREAQRMMRLVSDLLSLSRVEAEEHRAPTQSVDLVALARRAGETVRDQADGAGVALVLGPAPAGGAVVKGDADQLLQVLLNLLENAIKYGGGTAPARIDVTFAALPHEPKLRGPAIALSVRDHGEGIDPLHLPRLTERFYRVDSHRSREQGGTGLGLAIVKHIVNRHRGRLKIASEPGKGSEFMVILPAASPAASPARDG